MEIKTPAQFGKALKSGPYAWPGGYPVFFYTRDGAALSFDSAKENARQICQSIREKLNDGWEVVGVEINWENAGLYCDHSGKRIESAYAEPEETEESEK